MMERTDLCVRCGGRVVNETFDDEKSTSLWFEGGRCLNCGHIDDPIIRANRLTAPLPQKKHPARMVGAER